MSQFLFVRTLVEPGPMIVLEELMLVTDHLGLYWWLSRWLPFFLHTKVY